MGAPKCHIFGVRIVRAWQNVRETRLGRRLVDRKTFGLGFVISAIDGSNLSVIFQPKGGTSLAILLYPPFFIKKRGKPLSPFSLTRWMTLLVVAAVV